MSAAPSLRDFVAAVLLPAGPDALAWITHFDEPPSPGAHWNGHKCAADDVPSVNGSNAYFSIAGFAPTATARRIEQALGVCAVLIDDVGSKADSDRVLAMLGEPSYRIQTSAASQQWGYLLSALASEDEIKPIHARLQELKLCDRNGNNPVRYGRLPAGHNNKPEYGTPWPVSVISWNPERRFHIADIAARVSSATPAPVQRDEFEALAELITTGQSYHDPLAELSMRYAARGYPKADIVNILKSHMLASEDRSARWQDRFTDIARTVESAVAKCGRARADTIVLQAGHLPENVDAAIALLAERGVAASIFARGGVLVRPHLAERRGFDDSIVQSLELQTLTVPALQYELGQLCEFKRFSRGAKESTRASRQDCPPLLARVVLDIPHRWGSLPKLSSIASVPIYLGDGKLLAEPGYHAEREVFIAAPAGVSIPQAVSLEACRAALARLREWIAEFPFDSPESEAVMLAALLTAALRPSLRHAPGFALDAPEYASGKTTAAKLISIVAIGRLPPVMTFHRDPEEFRKTLDAAQMAGLQVFLYDNVLPGLIVSNDGLAQSLTEPERQPRELGASRTHTVACDALVLITGNNLTIGDDLTRRMLVARLEPIEQPITRVFRRPELLNEARRERVSILSDCFTIAAGGGHGTEAPAPLVGYGDWCRLIQWPLVALGVADPVASVSRLTAADPAREALDRVVRLWCTLHGTRWLKLNELLNAQSKLPSPSDKAKHWELMALFREEVGEDRDSTRVNSRKLGQWLKARKGVWTPSGLRVEWRPTSDSHPALWRVVAKASDVSAVSDVLGTPRHCATSPEREELHSSPGAAEQPEQPEHPNDTDDSEDWM